MTRRTSTAERLREHGLTATPQRAALLEALEGSQAHLSAEELHDLVRSEHPAVSLSTVYEALDRFDDVGLAARVQAGDGVTRHEARTEAHVNLVCPACGTVRDLDTPVVERLLEDVRRRGEAGVPDQPVELRAPCQGCRSTGGG